MLRTTVTIMEMKCKSCGIIHLLGETFNGQRCCDNPHGVSIGEREVVRYVKSVQEEREEVDTQMKNHNL